MSDAPKTEQIPKPLTTKTEAALKVANYWEKRLIEVRQFMTILATVQLYGQTNQVRKWNSDRAGYVAIISLVFTLSSIALIIASRWNKAYYKYLRYAFFTLMVRYMLLGFDITHNYQNGFTSDDRRVANVIVTSIATMYGLTLYFYHFDKKGFLHYQQGLVMLIIHFFSLLIGVQGKDFLQKRDSLQQVVYLLIFYGFFVYLSLSQHLQEEFTDSIVQNTQQEHQFKEVLDQFHEALLIVSPQGATYSNSKFKDQIMSVVPTEEASSEGEVNKEAFLSQFSMSQLNVTEEAPVQSIWTSTIWGKKQKRKKENRILEEVDEDVNKIVDARIFRLYRDKDDTQGSMSITKSFRGDDPTEEALSLRDIISRTSKYNGQHFHLLRAYANNEQASPETDLQYVQIKLAKRKYGCLDRILIQIIDSTALILYKRSQDEKVVLSLVNACVSHELRNPLNSIYSQTVTQHFFHDSLKAVLSKEPVVEAIKKSGDHATVDNLLSEIKDSLKVQEASSRIMSFLVQDFLDYAQIRSGKFRKNIDTFDLRKAVGEVMCVQAASAKQQGIDFYATFNRSSEAIMVTTDRSRVMQVLLCLQSNALKFTRQGKVEVVANILNGELQVSVIDTGVGIPLEDQDKLFRLFGFVQNTQQYNRNGIGLGLVIAQSIVDQFEGKMSFSSTPSPNPNHGSTFTYSFRLGDSNSPRQMLRTTQDVQISIQDESSLTSERSSNSVDLDISQTANFVHQQLDLARTVWPKLITPPQRKSQQYLEVPSFSPSPRRRGTAMPESEESLIEEDKRILIVDDQIFNIQSLQSILKYIVGIAEAEIDFALNGEEALAKIKQDVEEKGSPSYALIFMDCNMPFMDGYEATQKIVELLTSKQTRIPFICAITGHTEQSYIDRCYRSGMDRALSKPVLPDKVRGLCEELNIIQKKQ